MKHEDDIKVRDQELKCHNVMIMFATIQTQSHFGSTFFDLEEVNIFHPQMTISLAISLNYWPKNTPVQFLKGGFERTQTFTLHDKFPLSLLALCYQSNSENQVS